MNTYTYSIEESLKKNTNDYKLLYNLGKLYYKININQ